MPLKTQLDKVAWEWIDSTKPEDVGDSHVKIAYRLNIPACKPGSCRRNCKGNPQCLECLGEKEWFTEIADENWHVIDDPNTDRRPENSCVGLKNLGATCYVNSLLQLWYNNPTFRKAIYEWRQVDSPTSSNLPVGKVVGDGEDEPGSKTLIGQLQYIFALLQYSCRRYIDPSPFIKSLGLNTAQQQDAQEFSKLFLARLEDELHNQDNPLVKNIVQEQFSGDYSYVTRCSRCGTESARPSQFYELQLNIKGHKELGECIDEFLQDDKLEGENQYSCGNCQSLQDAVQKIKLHRLPPVLNLQLLRFIFDRETTRKRKLNAAIKFPEVLDMGKYVGTTGNRDSYNLAAVLIHRGPSAYSGHYVALVRNHLSGEWFQFNDETVKKLGGQVLQLSAEDDAECDGPSKGPKNAKATKGFHETKNAYMLVYARNAESPPDTAEKDCEEWKLSDELREEIGKDNTKFEEWVAEMTSMREQNVESGKAKQDEVKRIYQMMHKLEDDSWDFLPTAWITKWLRDNNAVAAIDNAKVLCAHQRLLPENAIKVKRIASSAADIVYEKYGGGPRLRIDSLCKDCVVQRCHNMRLKNQLSLDTKLISSMAKHKILDCESAYWVGRMSMRRWRILVLKLVPGADSCDGTETAGSGTEELETANSNGHAPATEESYEENGECVEDGPLNSFNEDIVCVHRNLTMKESCRRLVPESVWQRLTYYFPSAPTFNRDSQPCPICKLQVADDQEAKDAQKALAVHQRTVLCDIYHDRHRPHLLHQDSLASYVVSTDFIQDLRRFLREPHRRPPVTQVNNSKLVCSHGGLIYPLANPLEADSKLALVTESEWETIGQLFTVDTTVKVTWTRASETGPFLPETQPGLCLECHEELVREEERQLLEYDSARIYICKVSPKDTTDTQVPVADAGEDVLLADEDIVPVNKRRKSEISESPNTLVSPADSKRVRRSQRHRKGRDEKTVNVSSKQTLRDLKVQIMQLFSVAPYDQHLTVEGRSLTDGGATLADLRVLPGSVIYLQADEPNEEAMDFNDDYMPSGTPEEGFKGTELLRS